jgi:hypothetical protein
MEGAHPDNIEGMLYYADMEDNNPFQTKALAFPLASLYFARNNSSLGSVPICQTLQKTNERRIPLT